MASIYDWQRYWLDSTDGDRSLEPAGFLIDPEDERSRWRVSANRLDEMAEIPCLVLLGEPGMGKTFCLKAERDRLKAAGQATLFIELGRIASDAALHHQIFEAPELKEWKEGSNVLHLLLDSLDEGMLQIKVVHRVLVQHFQAISDDTLKDRLRLRISCRSADWPSSFTEELQDLFEKEGVAVRALAPLTRRDVLQAAGQEGLDPNPFLQEVERVAAGPFASRPVTLKMLLSIYRADGRLPSRKIEIYQRGCEELCADPSRHREEIDEAGQLGIAKRFIIASHMAAMMVLTNRPVVRLGARPGEAESPEEIRLSNLERLPDNDVTAITAAEIKEVVQHSALFHGAGANRHVWAHRTYAEFLAATQLVRSGSRPERILQWVQHPGSRSGKLIPQLQETAAWLAALKPPVFDLLAGTDPEALLRSDVAAASNLQKETLFQKLAENLQNGEITLDSRIDNSGFAALNWPGLPACLKTILEDRVQTNRLRVWAAQMATLCNCNGQLHDGFVAIVQNPSEKTDLRVASAKALGAFGMPKAAQELRQVLAGNAPHWLMAEIIAVLLPDAITPDELFRIMEDAAKENQLLHYTLLWRDRLNEVLHGDGLLAALRWLVRSQPYRSKRTFGIKERFEGIIFSAAWKEIHDPKILREFVHTVVALVPKWPLGMPALDNFNREYSLYPRRRHIFLTSLAKPTASDERLRFDLGIRAWQLAEPEDTSWLIEQTRKSTDPGERAFFAQWTRKVADLTDESVYHLVWEASRQFVELAEAFHLTLGPIALNGDTAKWMREGHEMEARNKPPAADEQPPAKKSVSPTQALDEWLTASEAGVAGAWWSINKFLLFPMGTDGFVDDSEFDGDLTYFPAWNATTETERRRILNAAALFLERAYPATNQWFSLPATQVDLRPIAIYRAFCLLHKAAALPHLSPARWGIWAPAVLSALALMSDSPDEDDILPLLLEKAPKATINATKKLLEERLKRGESPEFLRAFGSRLPPTLAAYCWNRFRSLQKRPARDRQEILRALLRLDFAPALAWLRTRIAAKPKAPSQMEDHAWIRLGLEMVPQAVWNSVWSACLRDPTAGIEFLSNGGHTWLFNQKANLTSDQRAVLFVWLMHQSPRPPAEPDQRELRIASFRSSVFESLSREPTEESLRAFEWVVAQLPDNQYLVEYLIGLKRQHLENTAPWPAPSDVSEVLSKAERRYVRTDRELGEVVGDALARLQVELHGETPAARDLWDRSPEGKYRPKNETEVSDYIARYLRRELPGIVVNREVEITPSASGIGSGERTDLKIEAVDPRNKTRYTAVVEVKGSWNRDLLTSLETQLVDRYLAEKHFRCGLYLVVWFESKGWDSQDRRSRTARKLALSNVEAKLQEQARALSSSRDLFLSAFVLQCRLGPLSPLPAAPTPRRSRSSSPGESRRAPRRR